jgi:putative transposase
MGISEATFYNRKKKYGGVVVSELQRLKRMVAELSPDIQFLRDVLSI